MRMLELLEDGPKMRKIPQVMDALLAEDRWITIHPHGDYEDYRRIEIDEEGNILKGGADPYAAWKKAQEEAPEGIVY